MKHIIILLGATGNLTKRKLIPGIYNLLSHNRIENFHILGIARRPLTGEKLISSAERYIKNPNKKILSKLKSNSTYLQLDFKNPQDYYKLKKAILGLKSKGSCNKLLYLATGSNNFTPISKNLQRIGITKEKNCWTRVVFEKPFGSDLKSANKLNKDLKRIFKEKRIYRIDHYLGKELVGNISIVRFQ